MPRANRNFLPGRIWHITHRCHKKEYLLKFRRDKRLWIHWALQAKIRFGLVILNFMITSNHIHLVAMMQARGRARVQREDMSRALQLIESRVAQSYNARKGRRGAFWEDRFHATAIEDGAHLARCITYVDMNMVRAAVVSHPRDWPFCGYRELMLELAAPDPDARRRGLLVDSRKLAELTGAPDVKALVAQRSERIDIAIRKGQTERDPVWTESVAVGSEAYLLDFQSELGRRIGASEIVQAGIRGDSMALRRTRGNPILVFGGEKQDLGLKSPQELT